MAIHHGKMHNIMLNDGIYFEGDENESKYRYKGEKSEEDENEIVEEIDPEDTNEGPTE